MLLGPTGKISFAKAPDHGELDPLRMALIIGLGQKVDRLKPDRQWRFAGFEDGAGDDRRLAMTPIALTQFTGIEMTAFVMAAIGKDEAIRPPYAR